MAFRKGTKSSKGKPKQLAISSDATGKPRRRRKTKRSKLIRKMLERLEDALAGEVPKATLADFIRLTQLERELEQEEQPREIVITWKEPQAVESTEK